MEIQIIQFLSSAKFFSTLGLILDIIGALLIWKYGIPSRSNDAVGQVLIVRNQTQEEDQKQKISIFLADVLSKGGIWFLILGFSLQIISNIVSI